MADLPKNKRGKNENVVGATEIEDKPLTPVTIRQTTFEVVLDFEGTRSHKTGCRTSRGAHCLLTVETTQLHVTPRLCLSEAHATAFPKTLERGPHPPPPAPPVLGSLWAKKKKKHRGAHSETQMRYSWERRDGCTLAKDFRSRFTGRINRADGAIRSISVFSTFFIASDMHAEMCAVDGPSDRF